MASLAQTIMNRLRPAARAERPAVVRIGTNAFSAIYNARRREMFKNVHRQPESRFNPVGVCRFLNKPIDPKVADGIFDATQIVNLLALLGCMHKVTGPANALLQLWTITYRNSFGMILHNDNMLVMHQIATGLTPSADALSVDALIRDQSLLPEKYSRSYGGVNTLANLGTVAVYFISGVAKVRSSYGWSWAGGEALRDQIASDAIRKEVFGSKAPKNAGTFFRAKGPIGVLAVGALAVELLAPVALADRRLGQLFSVAACGMHWGIKAVMGINFKYNLSGVSYLGFFPVGPELKA